MVRPKKQRVCRFRPEFKSFHPSGLAAGEPVQIGCDELEAVRLADLHGFSQEVVARSMRVARSTVADMLDSAHRKIAKAIIEGRILEVITPETCTFDCESEGTEKESETAHLTKPTQKREDFMRIALPIENDIVCQHFGRAPAFRIYDIKDNQVAGTSTLNAAGQGHEALAKQLGDAGVDTVICGGMGNGAYEALAGLGIQVIGGASGSPDQLVGGLLDYLQFAMDYQTADGCGCGCGGGCCGDQGEAGGCSCGCGGSSESEDTCGCGGSGNSGNGGCGCGCGGH
jgi:predicted DNA-binding protein (UPF0251 family)/predicted Fe-Mo cluster-binding NifX family protein